MCFGHRRLELGHDLITPQRHPAALCQASSVARRQRPIASDAIPWSEGTRVVSGSLAPGVFDFSYRRELGSGRRAPFGTYGFDRVEARSTTFDLDHLILTIANSQFDECVFRQDPALDRGLDPKPQGSLGHRLTTYRRCRFERVRFADLGGFRLGASKFDECEFYRCRWGVTGAKDASFIDCSFVGPLGNLSFRQDAS